MLVLVGIGLYAFLLAAEVVPNPFPAIWEWVSRDRPIAPDMAWQERFGSRPAAAAVAGDNVLILAGERAEIRDQDTGRQRTPGDPPGWEADWLAVAGEGERAVVITGRPGSPGYEVRDPNSGRVLHEDEDAVTVWTYRDARLDLRCDDQRACSLSSYRPAGADTPEWTIDLPGRRRDILGLNPELAMGRSADPNQIEASVAGPQPLPRMIGLPMERRSGEAVVVVETATGVVHQIVELADGEKAIVVGDRVIRSVSERHNGVCVSSATGYDPVTGTVVWGPQPYHVWSLGACEQRDPPLSAGSAMVAVGPEGRPLVVDAYDGRVLWRGEVEDSVAALSAELAIIRPGDGRTLTAVVLGGDGSALWERDAEPDADVLIAECGVVVADRDPRRVYVWDPRSGEVKLSVPTSAKVLACADGVVLTGGRSVGFVPFDGIARSDPEQPQEPLDSK